MPVSKAARPQGRPSKYKKAYCADLLTYFQQAYTLAQACDQRTDAPRLPTLVDFAMQKGVTRGTLHNWQKKYAPFQKAVEGAMELQEALIAEMALKGVYNAATAALMLKHNHGWADKQTVEQVSNVTMVFSKEDADC
jgi:hypothetical protein